MVQPVFLFLSFLLCASVTPINSLVFDGTLSHGRFGANVVDAVITKIRRSSLFEEDYNLIRRLAYTRSKFTPPPQGGIWGLSQSQFNFTILNTPLVTQNIIKNEFKLQWNLTIYEDCYKPMYSGLAATLFISLNKGSRILSTIADQCQFMITNNLISLNQTTCIQQIHDLEKGILCHAPFDLTLVIGGSASNSSTFNSTSRLEKEFTQHLFASMIKSDLHSRFGLIAVHDNRVVTRFPLKNPYNDYEIQRIVEDTGYANGSVESTRINEGIKVAVEMINGTVNRYGERSQNRILVIFSHRESDEDGGVSNIALARQLNLKTYAITIGPSMSSKHTQELNSLSQNNPRNMWRTNEVGISELWRRMVGEFCNIHRSIPGINFSVGGTLGPSDKHYNYFQMTNGYDYTFYLMTSSSALKVFLSYTIEHPSSEMYDLTFGSGGHILPTSPAGTTRVYVTVQNEGTVGGPVSYSIIMERQTTTTTTLRTTTQKTTTKSTTESTTKSTTTTTGKPNSSNVTLPTRFTIGVLIFSTLYIFIS